MPSTTNNSDSDYQAPRPKRGYFFGLNSEPLIRNFKREIDPEDLKTEIESLISYEQKKGKGLTDIKVAINKHLAQKIALLHVDMKKSRQSPENIAQITKLVSGKLQEITSEIFKDLWLQDLKSQCEAIIVEGQGNGTAEEDLIAEVHEFVKNQIKKLELRKKDANTSEEKSQMTQRLFEEAKEIIGPLLPEQQESQQEISNEVDKFLWDIESKFAGAISKQQKQEPKLEDLFGFVYYHINLQISGLNDSLTKEGKPPKKRDKIVSQAFEKLQRRLSPLLLQLDKDDRLELKLDVNRLHDSVHGLKIECEAIIAEEQKKGTARHSIEANVKNFIAEQIALEYKFMAADGKTPEEIEKFTVNTSQELEQFVFETMMTDGWLRGLKTECEALIAREQEKGTAPKGIKKQVYEIIRTQLKTLKESKVALGKSNQEAEREIRGLDLKIVNTIVPLLPKKQKHQGAATRNDLSGMQSPIIHPRPQSTTSKPTPPPRLIPGKSVRPSTR